MSLQRIKNELAIYNNKNLITYFQAHFEIE